MSQEYPKCQICGKPAYSSRPQSKPNKTCGAPECRLELRRIVGRESGKKIKAKKTLTRECLRCGQPFKTDSRFIRLCLSCKDINRSSWPGADYWGAVI